MNVKKFKDFQSEDRKDTKVISAFAGCGKSSYHKENPETTLDSDSIKFSWLVDDKGNKVRDPDFPSNYIDNIKQNIGKYDIIFVSQHENVRDMLSKNDIVYYLVYPEINMKDEYLKRYKERGNDTDFIKLLDTNWDKWITDLDNLKEDGSFIRMKMTKDCPYITNVIEKL